MATPLDPIIVNPPGRISQLELGAGNNQQARASDVNPIIDYLNARSSDNQGTVTQATSIATAVTLNGVMGTITTVSSTIAAGAEQAITLNNSSIAADSVIFWNATTSGTGDPIVIGKTQAAGSVSMVLKNVHAAAAFNNTIKISFIIF